MPLYQLLTDRTLAQSSAITPTTLIHIVYTGDPSQNIAGSSYKAELGQLAGLFSGGSVSGDYLPLSGGTVSGATNFTNGLTANTISATTYLNLPQFSGGSGNCITDLYTTNIHSCSPLNINPLDEGNVYFGSTSGVTIDVTNSRLGINNSNPQYRLDILDTDNRLYYDPSSAGGTLSLSGNTKLPRYNIITSPYLTKPLAGGSIGTRAWDDVIYGGYGNVGDMHIYANNSTNGLNIINQGPGTNTEDYIRFYAGRDALFVPDMHIQGSGTTRGYVGIGTTNPSEKLDVSGKTKTTNFQMTSGATNSYVLTSDASGNASWQASTGGGSSINPYNNVGSTGTTFNWDVSGLSTNYQVTLTANTTLSLTSVRNGEYGTLIVTQDGVGGRTLTLGNVNGGSGTHRVANGGGGSVVLTSNASATDTLTFTYNGSTMYWTVGNDYT